MDEKSLWKCLKAGDKSALEKIYRTFFKSLYLYGKKFTTEQSIIEDCIQDLFIEIWEKRDRLSDVDQIKPYLFTSLRRKIIAVVKTKRIEGSTELEDFHFEAGLSIEDVIISREGDLKNKKKLEQAFNQLSNRQKEILYHKFYNQFDYKVISEIMDMNYQSARNLVSRAITKLSQILNVWWVFLSLFLKT